MASVDSLSWSRTVSVISQLKPVRRQAGCRQRVGNRLDEPRTPELRGREIDGDLQIVGPLRGCGTSVADGPFAERHDQPDFLGQRDEGIRRNHALFGVAPANEGFKAADAVGRKIDHRLIVQLELAGGERPAQVAFQRVTDLHLRVHLLLEEAVGAATVAFGPVEGEIRVANDLVGAHAVRRAERDADTGADHDLMAVDLVGRAERLDYPVGKGRGIGRLRNRNLHDCELVAPHAGDRVGLAHLSAQPIGYHLQELVACGMTECVVHVLEVVEVQHVGGDHLAAHGAGQRVLESFVQQDAVRQARQSVVQGHVRDLRLGAALVGDVLMRRDDPAVGHALNRYGDAAAVCELAQVVAGIASGHACQRFAHQLICIPSGVVTQGDAALQDLAQCRAGSYLLRRQPIHLRIAVVGNDDALIGIEHGQALHHIVEGCVELQVLHAQLLFMLLEQAVLLLELSMELLALGDVLMRDQPAAVRHAARVTR